MGLTLEAFTVRRKSMAVVAKRSVMTLYSGNDVYSHQARIVLAEKGVNYEVVEVTSDKVP